MATFFMLCRSTTNSIWFDSSDSRFTTINPSELFHFVVNQLTNEIETIDRDCNTLLFRCFSGSTPITEKFSLLNKICRDQSICVHVCNSYFTWRNARYQTRTTFSLCTFRHLVAMTELQRKQQILISLLLIRISN